MTDNQHTSDKNVADANVLGNFDHGLTLALSKGRILKETLPLLANANIALLEDPRSLTQAYFSYHASASAHFNFTRQRCADLCGKWRG